MLQFVVLDGASQFPLLALELASFMIGAALLMTLRHPVLSSLGRLNPIFILVIVAPSNPQTYDPQAFLFVSLFVCLSVALLLASQLLVPPLSNQRRRQVLIASARRETRSVAPAQRREPFAGRGDVSRRRADRPDRQRWRARLATRAPSWKKPRCCSTRPR